MQIPLYQVDAFTARVFGGNPAAVCPLEAWLADDLMQAIATENNLSETAFYVPGGGGFELRWFTPVAEIDLAGHPTLATAHVILDLLKQADAPLRLQTRKSGPLTVEREGDRLVLDFPAMPPAASPADWRASSLEAVEAALGRRPDALLAARDLIAIFPDEEAVRGLKPDFAKIAALDGLGLLVTAPGAPGSGVDFVSRFFAPKHDIMEDPVTGSAHCELIPYWAARLGKGSLFARQVSRRGGEIWCEDQGARVRIGGRCAFFMRGTIEL